MPYLLVDDVATLLGCSKRSVHERARLREIPHRKPPGMRQLLFVESELQAWLDGADLDVEELPRGGRVVRPSEA
jgi:excisionase family DNA binding protein